MIDNRETKKLPLIFHIAYFLFAATFCYLYYQNIIKLHYYDVMSSIPEVLNSTALKVFQYRVLVPYIIKVITLSGKLPEIQMFTIFSVIVVYLTLVVYRLILREYFYTEWINLFLAPTILYPMMWNFILNNSRFHCYDFTSILFFATGFYLIIKKKNNLLLAVFPLAVLNKESSVILIFAFLFYNYKKIFSKEIITKTLAMGVIFVLIKVSLYFIYISNDGSFLYNYLDKNLNLLYNALTFKDIIVLKDILMGFGGMYIFVFIFFLSGQYRTLIKSIDAGKVYINFTFIPFIIISFPVILVDEVRVYTEVIPMFTTLFICYLSTFKNLKIYFAKQKTAVKKAVTGVFADENIKAVIHHN